MSGRNQAHWKPVKCSPIARAYPVDNEEDLFPPKKPWLPLTLRKTYLGALIFSTVGLIFVIQWLCYVSRRDQGIIFADDISDLPLRRAFCYLYLPTIISVTYSFLWTWVEQDVRRLEPYFRLSRDSGASGQDSVLLDYPLKFILSIPWIAFKKRHWHVLSASTIFMLVVLGLTPTQAGIFAVRSVKVSENMASLFSSAYTPIDQQPNTFGQYIQSVSNIAWLNETLPPFMTKDFVLAPFGPAHTAEVNGRDVNFTGNTYLYSVDIECETPVRWTPSPGFIYYNTSGGCHFLGPSIRSNGGNDTSKPFDAMYEGYSNADGYADYYLSYYCNESFANYFYVRWSKSSPSEIVNGTFDDLSGVNDTSLFCNPTYYKRMARNATISLPSNKVISEGILGDKEGLPNDLINITDFQDLMSTGTRAGGRTDYPTSSLPDQKGYLANMPLNLAYLPQMAPFAIASTQQPLHWYLDAENLRLSYQSAYRLLFARELSEVLAKDLDTSSADMAHRLYITQAVVVIPGFAYAATAILVIILVIGIGMFATISRRSNRLTESPATLRNLMMMLAGDSTTVPLFSGLDGVDYNELKKAVEKSTFRIEYAGEPCPVAKLRGHAEECVPDCRSEPPPSFLEKSADTSNEQTRGVRPTEMKLGIGAIFLLVQVAAAITFAVLYYEARMQTGLPLPSTSTFVRQVVQHYIPIMLATLLEPFWLILNKMLCLLLPYEQLRKGNAHARRSVDLDYTSLPPQFVFWKAAKARHITLAVVCLMVLAADALAVALSGLMKETTVYITTPAALAATKAAKIHQLNGTGPPFNTETWSTFQGGSTFDQFYREMSNLTANTPLPAWTDTDYVYQPFNLELVDSNSLLQINTTAFGVGLKCQTLDQDSYTLVISPNASEANLVVPLDYGGASVNCSGWGVGQEPGQPQMSGLSWLADAQAGHVALEMAAMLAHQNESYDLFCRQHFLATWIRADLGFTGILPNGRWELDVLSRNDTTILCKPDLKIGPAEILVGGDGRVQEMFSANTTAANIGGYFSSKPEDLIAQANQFLTDNGATWHNDSFPSDFVNYLIQKSTNDTSLLNPSLPPPDAALAINGLSPLYTKLFAILVGANMNSLFENATSPPEVSGLLVSPETRIVFSSSAFIVVEAILICYIFTTILFYARRSWRILPRLPSTLASNIAFFAASHALRDLDNDQERGEGKEQWTWGYGSFIGVDGRLHKGIEKASLVTLLDHEGQPLRRSRPPAIERNETKPRSRLVDIGFQRRT